MEVKPVGTGAPYIPPEKESNALFDLVFGQGTDPGPVTDHSWTFLKEVSGAIACMSDYIYAGEEPESRALNPAEWLVNSYNWLDQLPKTGAIGFFVNLLQIPDTDHFRSCYWTSVFHKTSAIVFSRASEFEPIGQHKGEGLNGADLSVLVPHLTKLTPLTSDDPKKNRELKKSLVGGRFGSPNIQRKTEVIQGVGEKVFEDRLFSATGPVEIRGPILDYVARANFEAVFGSHIATMGIDIGELTKAVEGVGEFITSNIFFSPQYLATRFIELFEGVFPIPDLAYRVHQEVLGRVVGQIYEASIKWIGEHPDPHEDDGQIELMLRAGHSKEDVEGIIRLTLVVGQRTTGFTIQNAIRYLLLYPEWQEKIRAGEKETIRHFIAEVLRMDAPVPIQTREAEVDITMTIYYYNNVRTTVAHFEGYEEPTIPDGADIIKTIFIPKGTLIAYAHYVAQRNGLDWENPNTFNPDRWIGRKSHDDGMHVFSGRAHSCCGKDLASVGTIPGALIELLKKHRLEAADPEQLARTQVMGGFVSSLTENLRVRFIPV